MSKKKKDRLLLNLLEGEKHKHRVAMVNEEAEWNQHEPNSNMARMFVVMLLIHVVVIGGIVIYDWLNGEEAQTTVMVSEAASTSASALPSPTVNAGALESQSPIEDCATYEWRSGDSISSVASKLGVTEEVLIKMNMLDKGTQLEANSIIRYPKKPVVKAVGISVAGANGEVAKVAPTAASIAAAESAVPLTVPGEQTFSFQPTIESELAPTPGKVPVVPMIQHTPPPAVTKEATGSPAVAEVKKQVPAIIEDLPASPPAKVEVNVADSMPKAEPKPEPKVERKQESEVPKAIPVKRYSPPAIEKPATKKIADAPPAKKETKPASRSSSYTVKPNETLYSIATRHGVTVKALQAANKITKPESLRDGMKLVIPAK